MPSTTTPASRSSLTAWASSGATLPTMASEPPVVIIRSPVSMLSLIRNGTPWSGPRSPCCARSASSLAAISNASGLISMTDRSIGPAWSIAAIRCKYASHSPTLVHSRANAA